MSQKSCTKRHSKKAKHIRAEQTTQSISKQYVATEGGE